MKVCVINFSGNVGKSLISQHLLKPRLKYSEIIAVESINSNGNTDEKIKGKEFTDIMDKVMSTDNVIVDVGASNVEDFIIQMKKSIGSQEDFDYFIVPTIDKEKQIIDTVSTIEALGDMGIEQERIRVIFNAIDYDTNIDRKFCTVIELDHIATINTNITIYENELFNRLKEVRDLKTIHDIANDDTDYKSLIAATNDKLERLTYSRRLGLKRLAIGVERMLDNTFEELFK